MFRAKVKSEYSGLVGLNVNVADFKTHVMLPDDIREFFALGKTYRTPFAYPAQLADGFDEEPHFYGTEVTDSGLTLTGRLVTNDTQPYGSCLTWFASCLLPDTYFAADHIRFSQDDKNGFGIGTCRITTHACYNEDSTPNNRLKNLLGVTNRPGLFLKIKDENGEFYQDACIFFPAQASGCSHSKVKYGEAFVLVNATKEYNEHLAANVKAAFDLLITKSYGNDQGLFSIPTYKPIEAFIPATAQMKCK